MGSSGGSTKQAPNYTRAEMKMFDTAARMIQQGLGQGATAYSGQTFAPMGQDFYDAVDSYRSFMEDMDQPLSSAAQQAISGKAGFTYDPKESSSYWEKNLATPAMSTWQNTIAPQIKEGFAGGGLFSSRLPQMLTQEASNFYGQSLVPALYSAQMSDRQMGIASKESALDRQSQMLPFVSSMGGMLAGQGMSIAGAQQQQQQLALDDRFNQFLRMAPENNPWLQTATAWRGSPSTVTNIHTPGTDWAGGLMSLGGALGSSAIGAGGMKSAAGILAAGGGGGGAELSALMATLGMFASDSRLKEDIKKIPNALDKIKQISGNTYIFENHDRAGVIAQEVREVLPEAVFTNPETGYLGVDYPAVLALLVEAVKELSDRNEV